jgi:hypothetical protein
MWRAGKERRGEERRGEETRRGERRGQWSGEGAEGRVTDAVDGGHDDRNHLLLDLRCEDVLVVGGRIHFQPLQLGILRPEALHKGCINGRI